MSISNHNKILTLTRTVCGTHGFHFERHKLQCYMFPIRYFNLPFAMFTTGVIEGETGAGDDSVGGVDCCCPATCGEEDDDWLVLKAGLVRG